MRTEDQKKIAQELSQNIVDLTLKLPIKDLGTHSFVCLVNDALFNVKIKVMGILYKVLKCPDKKADYLEKLHKILIGEAEEIIVAIKKDYAQEAAKSGDTEEEKEQTGDK